MDRRPGPLAQKTSALPPSSRCPPATHFLADRTSEFSVSVWLKKNDPAVGLNCSESENFAVECGDPARREVRHAYDEAAQKGTPVIPLPHRG